MTLAIILLLNISCAILINSGAGPHSPSLQQTQSSSAAKPASPSDTQNQAPAQPSSTTAPASQTPSAKPSHRKKKIAADCNPTPANSGSEKNSTAPSTGQQTNSSANGKATKPKSSSTANCPQQKTIVEQGGTSEPAIQLVGTPGGTPSAKERDTTQKLQSAEANLKKMETENLDSGHQDIIKQIRQFIHESKVATAAGDLDRASTLADKAKLLSDELLNPQK